VRNDRFLLGERRKEGSTVEKKLDLPSHHEGKDTGEKRKEHILLFRGPENLHLLLRALRERTTGSTCLCISPYLERKREDLFERKKKKVKISEVWPPYSL